MFADLYKTDGREGSPIDCFARGRFIAGEANTDVYDHLAVDTKPCIILPVSTNTSL